MSRGLAIIISIGIIIHFYFAVKGIKEMARDVISSKEAIGVGLLFCIALLLIEILLTCIEIALMIA